VVSIKGVTSRSGRLRSINVALRQELDSIVCFGRWLVKGVPSPVRKVTRSHA